jgi:DNA-binding CsgD family transcriptional regulator
MKFKKCFSRGFSTIVFLFSLRIILNNSNLTSGSHMLISKTYTSHSKAVKAILEPFKNDLGIIFFTYCRYQNDRYELFHCNHQAAAEFINDTDSILPLELKTDCSIIKWEQYCSKRYLSYLSDQYQGTLTGITLNQFSSNTEAEHISIGVFEQHQKTLTTLISNKTFRNKVISTIRSGVLLHKSKLISTHSPVPIQIKAARKKLSDPLVGVNDNHFIHGLIGPAFITHEEYNCLRLLLTLRTLPNIAVQLKISQAKVDSLINTLKSKLGAKNKHDLYRVARNNMLLPYKKMHLNHKAHSN